MGDSIVGICRFSFLGRCDWVGTAGLDRSGPDILARRKAMLYAPERLERRFAAFETMCLPSVRAQTDADFQFWVLTSPELPQPWMQRLRDLCAGVAQIRVIVSDRRDTQNALRDHLRAAADAAGGRPVIQFRVDDDDAVSRHHVARLRRHARRMEDLPGFAISYPQGLVLGSYGGEPVSYWRAHQPFLGAGAAVRMRGPGRCIHAFDHFQLPQHFPALTDVEGLGYVQTRWDEGDSVATIVARFPRWFRQLSPESFHDALAEDFPFLRGADLGFARRKGAA
ncbi:MULTISPECIES: glycosyltransferase [unclassified Paracoccus (in: a-proteobacteria)]|uniref:glycosyltransferase n=1 Tax=unclassified Paracoccus (in: a-proteobacteria) TaxID=2688777 RepID=UPI0012B1CCDB|nr:MULTISPECIES: glycosyltransferase [unclassified Paracoccus (in: a-proteobacteria)]UXU74270.1 putative rhamnosyl transferase [Paracoccus sp. SMMA_5]UXU80161.1 putative rhamnosyl transferase [Paracoccus sp. SMMA_5_TC]